MSDDDLEITVDGRSVTVSNPDKVLFPRSGITKAEMARYYQAIGPTMVRHVGDRPITLVRYPSGIEGKGFFQKNTPDYYPDWIPRVELVKKGGTVRHCVVDHPAALVYFAQQNVITPHMGLATVASLDRPDRFVVDLDPSQHDFDQMRRVAHGTRSALERAGLVPFVQLTGSKGVHIVAPLTGTAPWSEVGRFGRALSTMLLQQFPDDLTMEFSKSDRGEKIYLDMGRNNYQSTMAAPYGVRPFEGAPVATPIDWDELDEPGLDAQRYTITTVLERLAERGDAWETMAESARPLPSE